MSVQQYQARVRAREVIALFLLHRYPRDQFSSGEAHEADVQSLDAAFLDFFHSSRDTHFADCSLCRSHQQCPEGDAIRLLHPGSIDGVSQLFRARLLEACTFDVLGRMTVPLHILWPKP